MRKLTTFLVVILTLVLAKFAVTGKRIVHSNSVVYHHFTPKLATKEYQQVAGNSVVRRLVWDRQSHRWM